MAMLLFVEFTKYQPKFATNFQIYINHDAFVVPNPAPVLALFHLQMQIQLSRAPKWSVEDMSLLSVNAFTGSIEDALNSNVLTVRTVD